MSSVYSETREALPGILGKAAEQVPVKALKGASYITEQGVVLYEVTLAEQDLVLVFGHIPFGEMIEAVCAFLTAENPENLYASGSFDQQHEIARNLTYRRITMPEDISNFDMSKLNWFGGHTPVTVWVR